MVEHFAVRQNRHVRNRDRVVPRVDAVAWPQVRKVLDEIVDGARRLALQPPVVAMPQNSSTGSRSFV